MARKKIPAEEAEGHCLGIADGKIVVKSRSIAKVMNTLVKQYPKSEITITSVPKGGKVFVL